MMNEARDSIGWVGELRVHCPLVFRNIPRESWRVNEVIAALKACVVADHVRLASRAMAGDPFSRVEIEKILTEREIELGMVPHEAPSAVSYPEFDNDLVGSW